MKKTLFTLYAVLLIGAVFIQQTSATVFLRRAASSGDYTQENTDTFSDTNNPVSGWTSGTATAWQEDGSDLYITSSDSNAFIIHNSTVSSADQYNCVTISDIDAKAIPGLALRHDDLTPASGEYFYVVRNFTDDDDLNFRSCDFDGSDANCSTFFTVSSYSDFVATDVMCFAVEGTGASTIFYFWKNPSDDPPLKSDADICIDDNGGSCTATSSNDWDDGTNQGPDEAKSFADSGSYTGIMDMHSYNSSKFDDYKSGVD